jgi:hypothetical protein
VFGWGGWAHLWLGGLCVNPHSCLGPQFHEVPFPPLVPSSRFKTGVTKGHDKLGMGVTQESHKVLWHEFPMGGQGPSKHREGKTDRDEGQADRTREGMCE